MSFLISFGICSTPKLSMLRMLRMLHFQHSHIMLSKDFLLIHTQQGL